MALRGKNAEVQARRQLIGQILALVLVWLYVVGLHSDNDGLWYQGDAPRHAANGLFWKDFLARFPVNPVEFAVSYYVRYPVITPSAYPPGFYLLEVAAYSVFGPSPFVAKGLVLAFTLLGGLYLTAWLRRWVAAEAGWAGSLLVLQPGVIGWSHAVMLNVPAMALSVAALYHARRWIEAPTSRHLYAVAALSAAAAMTYVHTVVVFPIVLLWILIERRWDIFHDRRVWVLLGLGMLVLAPWAIVAIRWAPVHVSVLSPPPNETFGMERWTYYLRSLSELLSPLVLMTVPLSILGVFRKARRNETILVLVWSLITYAALSYVMARDIRYGLLLVPPCLILGLMGVGALVTAGWKTEVPSWAVKTGITAILAAHIWAAPGVPVPKVDGFRELVAFIDESDPGARIFYDGAYNGNFSFYLRARDLDFKHGVVLGNKILYASSIDAGWHLIELVSSPTDVVTVLRKECGCSWVVVERAIDPYREQVKAIRYLREAVKGPEFELVKTFPIQVKKRVHADPHKDDIQVDVYRLVGPIAHPDQFQYHFPVLGEGTVLRAKPLER